MESAGAIGIAMNIKAFYNLSLRVLTSKELAFILRLYIGGLFVFASLYKMNHAAEFAESIANYQLVPYWAVNVLAVTMPWLELVCGLMLVIGFRAKSVTVMIGVMMAMFTVALVINVIWETPIGCGCFSTSGDLIGWHTVLRDVIWLAMIIHIYYFDRMLHLENRFMSMLQKIQ